ncbi:general stress protein [Carnobacterium mobile]|uniref:general stress protein n=1 Tax=Carnobacterium mobile TaxID=2750 RepID=UPI001869627B|nr:general stress protein [Carnobacterium mobile]
MPKFFKSAYQSVEEAAAEVEHLLVEGYAADDITVVTYKENKGAIESLTIADVDTVTGENHQSIWDRARDVFTDGDSKNPLGKYNLDPAITERYNKAIKNGGYVILVEEALESDTIQTNNKTSRRPIQGQNNNTVPNVGEYSAAHSDVPTNENNDAEATVDGIPLKESDGSYGGNHPTENPSMPTSPGTDQQRDIPE